MTKLFGEIEASSIFCVSITCPEIFSKENNYIKIEKVNKKKFILCQINYVEHHLLFHQVHQTLAEKCHFNFFPILLENQFVTFSLRWRMYFRR